MSTETTLRDRLNDELAHLPTVPPGAYLIAGRRVRRRRRVALSAAAVVVVATATQVLSPGGSRESQIAEDPIAPDHVSRAERGPDPDYLAPAPNNPVEAVDGLADVDWFTTDDVPAWAQEHGDHGPVGLTPDGRLWVAPDAEISRVVVDPYPPGEHGITASYAVEASWASSPEELGGGLVWEVIATDGTSTGTGTMDEPGRWTDDFELWVDDATSHLQRRPSFAERLLRFDGRSDSVVPGADGVELLRVVRDPVLGRGWETPTRVSAAEVGHGGQRWFVVAFDPEDGAPWYEAWDANTAADFDGFLDQIAKGWQ